MRILTVVCCALFAAFAVSACDDDDSPEITNTYTVRFDLAATSGAVGALQFDVEYRGSGEAGWVGAGGGAACRWLVQAAIHACNDKRGGLLTCAVVDTGGFTGPTPLLECELMVRGDTVTADDFDVRVTDASTPNLRPIDATVVVGAVTAASASTTTTTDPDNPPTAYDVVFELPPGDDTTASIGALQLEITHGGVSGGWIGSGPDVDCHWLVSADITGCNENSNRLLTCALVSVAGIRGPFPILECGFASYDPIVEPSDFGVAVVDASAPNLLPIDVNVAVASVTER